MIKMKVLLKISIILIVLLTIQLLFSYSYAIPDSAQGGTTIISDPEKFKPDESKLEGNGVVIAKAEVIASIIRNCGIVLSIIIMMVIGIKAMVGSVEEKSEFKEVLPLYVIGALMIFFMSWLPFLIYSFVKKIK